MNRAEKRRQKKLAKGKATSAAKAGVSSVQSTRQSQIAIQASLDRAVQHHSKGEFSKAEGIYQQILETEPNQPAALHLLGVIAYQAGKADTAVDLIQKALTILPDYAEAHYNLGNVLRDQNRLDEAESCFRKAVSTRPDFATAYCNLGLTLQDLKKPNEAIRNYQKAKQIMPGYADAHYNLGNALQDLNRLDEAEKSYREALALKPGFVEAHTNLGNALKSQIRFEEAVQSYREALRHNPKYAEAHNNLGTTLKELNQLDEAITCFNNALKIRPGYTDAHHNLINTLQSQGDVDGAVRQLDVALSHNPKKAAWRIRKALSLPTIPRSEEDIQTRRKNLAEAVKDLKKQNLTINDPVVEIGMTNFFLSYHNEDNREIMEDIAELYMDACPKLMFEAAHCRQSGKRRDKHLRIGFLSSFFCEHTIGKLSHGFIEHLSRELFVVTVFRFPGENDPLSEAIEETADRVVPLHKDLNRDRDVIEQEKLDILFYPDIGMDPYTYFLSFARLAPVQVVSWGHPDTTGIPNIDYFLSAGPLEHPGSSAQYTEQLVQLSALPTYYTRPVRPEKTYSRSDFGLPDQEALYVCPQTLFKLHPGFDTLVSDLMVCDPDGYVVLIDDGKGGHLNDLIIERIGSSHPDIIKRIIFLPTMSHEKFLGLLLLADAILDIPTFSGGNSSLEAIAMTAPVVTWPGNFMRCRVTAGCYKQMGLSDLIATDAGTYVSLALKLAHDADFRKRMKTDIEANCHKLFERTDVIREMEIFFIRAYQAQLEEIRLGPQCTSIGF